MGVVVRYVGGRGEFFVLGGFFVSFSSFLTVGRWNIWEVRSGGYASAFQGVEILV